MKIRASLSPTSRKSDSHALPFEIGQNRLKSHNTVTREGHTSPTNVKLAKEKPKPKKENKPKRKEETIQGKKTKRKQTKKYQGDLNSTILMNEQSESKKRIDNIAKLKTKTSLKGLLKNPKKENQSKKSSRCDWFNGFLLDSTVQIPKNKQKKTTMKIALPNEEYLFIGDQFYQVGNYCPTKRLLNSLREHCSSSLDHNIKFVPQDKGQKPNLQLKKKNNIFLEARRQIQLKLKTKKVIIIQRWWRKILRLQNLKNPRSNPQHINENSNQEEEKVSFCESRESEKSMRSPFEMGDLNQSPIADKKGNNEDSIIASFNSADFMDERQPKKIQFTKQNISNMLSNSYRLPQQPEANSQQNQQIFNDYSKFKKKSSNSLTDSQDSLQEDHKYIQQIHPTQNYNINFCKPITPNDVKVEQAQLNLLKQFEEATKIKEMIELRILEQKGQLKKKQYTSKVGVSTSILATHSFLVNFFNFYIQQYREEFVSLINMPFGYSLPARLRHLSGQPLPQEEEQDEEGVIFGLKDIIDSNKLQEYYEYTQHSEPNSNSFFRANLQIQKIHNRAVLDYFNQELNKYRPYSQINGVPYPWNHSYKALTFYCIGEQNIAEIFQKVEIAILKSCTLLCGIHIDQPSPKTEENEDQVFQLVSFMEGYEQKTHGLILEHNEEKELKHLHEEVKKDPFQWDNEMFTGIILEVAAVIFEDLTNEVTIELWNQIKKDIY